MDMPHNRLMLLHVTNERNSAGAYFGVYRCDCGVEKKIAIPSVESGRTRSCGCLDKERRVKHGMSRTREYSVWKSICHRCLNQKSKDFPRYGGRGITICPQWASSFETFYNEVGPIPDPSLQIDRIDNTKGYEPGNVRWASVKMQARNRRSSMTWNIKGRAYPTLSDAAKDLGVSRTLIRKWAIGYTEPRTGRQYPPKDGCFATPQYPA